MGVAGASGGMRAFVLVTAALGAAVGATCIERAGTGTEDRVASPATVRAGAGEQSPHG